MPPIKLRAKDRPLRAIGVTCGIGSMLVGARQAGFEVLGNIEWRRYYHYEDPDGNNTFLENFPGADFPENIDQMTDEQVAKFSGADLLMGHPECGNFSNLGSSSKNRLERLKDPCDIPLFVDLVAKLRPRFFAMDDLPKSFGAFGMEEYARRLPDYDLFPEWVSNYHYGNIQKNRKRMFMLGCLKTEGWVFVPGERHHDETVAGTLGHLPEPGTDESVWNHEAHVEEEKAGRARHLVALGRGAVGSWRDLRDYFQVLPEGGVVEYVAEDGSIKRRMGNSKGHWDSYAHVLDGSSCQVHPRRCLPYTIRERATIQGFPEDFVFYGTRLDDEGRWNHDKNVHMTKQTGKAMPVQFCRYVANQIAHHLRKKEFESSGERLLTNNPEVDRAKKWYCQEVGYSDQQGACSRCWLYDRCTIRTEKYGIGPEAPVGRATKRVKIPAVETPRSTPSRSVDRSDGPSSGIGSPRPIEVVEFYDPTRTRIGRVEEVSTSPGIPDDYHCRCRFCSRAIGNLIRSDGTPYNRLDRRRYYDPIESGPGGHIAKTPLHVARWAVQRYTKAGDWVLDPTAGAGTTLVEALTQGRNAVGVELEYQDIIQANVKRHTVGKTRSAVGLGDCRSIRKMLEGRSFHLVQNNPPYFGDQSPSAIVNPKQVLKYDSSLPNLGLLKEGPEYWEWIEKIYSDCRDFLVPGGRFVVGVKDQMRNRSPDQLHEKLANVLEKIGLDHEGTAFLRHYPTTLHLNTYFKRYGVHPPYYQTILVFQRKGGRR